METKSLTDPSVVTDLASRVRVDTAAQNLTASQKTNAKTNLDLNNVENKSSATIRGEITTANITSKLGGTPILTTEKGVANGVAVLDENGKITPTQIPGSVEEIFEFTNLAAFPTTGTARRMYVALDTNKVYRWGGSAYVEISASPGSTDAVPEGTNQYFTLARVRAAVLTGISLTTNAAITATDTVLTAFGKLQKQVTDLIASVALKAPLASPALTGTPTIGGSNVLHLGNINTYLPANSAVQVTTQDWNTLTTPGTYQVASMNGANRPFTYAWGTLVVTNVANTVTQVYYPHQGEITIRQYYGAWQPWRGALDNLNFNAYAPGLNGAGAYGSWNITAAGVPWGGISGKPTTIEDFGIADLRRATVPNNVWVRDYTQPGFYRVNENTGQNSPPWNFGNFLTVNGGGDTYGQIYFDYNSSQVAVRGGVVGQLGTAWQILASANGGNATGTWPIAVTGNAGNTSSCTNAVWTKHNWEVRQLFKTKRNGYTTNSPGAHDEMALVVYSNDNGPAHMTFLREGQWGVNFGLDWDKTVRLGGWNVGDMFAWNTENGNYWAAGNISAFSDERRKKNWRALPANFIEDWAKVLHGVYDRVDMDLTQVGLGAQSVQKILPWAVNVENDDIKSLSLNYGAAAAVASVAAAQEIVSLKVRVSDLEHRVNEQDEITKSLIKAVEELKRKA